MCKFPTLSISQHIKTAKKRSLLSLIWPVHPLFIIGIAPFLPTSLYINRGYTSWYHYITIVYLLTNHEPLRRFLILQGTFISSGWYAAFASDLYLHGRFGHILYMNMPNLLKSNMVDPLTSHVFYTPTSALSMAFSHVLDTLLHPGIVYLLLRSHLNSGKRAEDVVSWSVLGAVFAVSRFWSVLHTWYNTGTVGGWYFGYEVYHIHDLDSWMPAYVTEGVLMVWLVVGKLIRGRGERLGRSGSGGVVVDL